MNKYAQEKWDYYDGIRAYIVRNLEDERRYGDYRAKTDKEEIARLIAAAPEMYRLLEGAANFLELKSKYNVSFEGYAGIIHETLAQIDGEGEA